MTKNNKTIVFYSATTPTIMLYKMARLFKKNNYPVVLLTMCEKNQINYKFYKNAFDKIICSDFQFTKSNLNFKYIFKKSFNLIKFLAYMRFIKPKIIIGVSGSNWQLKLAHKYFFKKYPFIYFPYDILSHFFNTPEDISKRGPPKFELEAEKYCFENSDGIIHKGDPNELNFLKKTAYKRITPVNKQLSFLPYCSKEFNIPINKNKLSEKDNRLHIVYPGFFFADPKSFEEYLKIFNDFFKQKIHIHIYSTVNHISKEEESKYSKNLFKELLYNKYFHLHNPIEPKELIPEISKYDFGCWFAYRFDLSEIKFHTGNKIASFLEAGLPIIYNAECRFLDKLLRYYDIGVSFNKQNAINLKKRVKKLNYKKLEKNVIKAREDFDMDKNFPRLESFIEEVIRSKESQQHS